MARCVPKAVVPLVQGNRAAAGVRRQRRGQVRETINRHLPGRRCSSLVVYEAHGPTEVIDSVAMLAVGLDLPGGRGEWVRVFFDLGGWLLTVANEPVAPPVDPAGELRLPGKRRRRRSRCRRIGDPVGRGRAARGRRSLPARVRHGRHGQRRARRRPHEPSDHPACRLTLGVRRRYGRHSRGLWNHMQFRPVGRTCARFCSTTTPGSLPPSTPPSRQPSKASQPSPTCSRGPLPRFRHHLTGRCDGGRRLPDPTRRPHTPRGAPLAGVAAHAVRPEGRSSSARLRGLRRRARARRAIST